MTLSSKTESGRFTAIEMLERLVSFDTTSSKSNLACVHFVRDYLAQWGVSARLSFNEDRSKANILATIGPDVADGIVLSGHMDVVPVAGQAWTTPPFSLTAADGRLYGRGSADMKAFIAVALALVPEFLDAGLGRPIHLALSYDEEVGCFGAPGLLRDLDDHIPRPQAVIVGEPTGMRIVNAQKGVRIYRTTVTGVETHASLPEKGVNAVTNAARLIAFLAGLEEELMGRCEGPDGESNDFDPPYGTLNIGRVNGGVAQNIVPRECVFDWETRLLPWADPDEIPRRFQEYVDVEVLPRMRKASQLANIDTETICDVPGLHPEPDSPAETLCVRLLGNNATDSVPFGSEAGLFQGAGLSTVICGPGEIAQAHRPDEFIETSQIEACEQFMRRLGVHLGASTG
jgi:acetylornithine deacetylase